MAKRPWWKPEPTYVPTPEPAPSPLPSKAEVKATAGRAGTQKTNGAKPDQLVAPAKPRGRRRRVAIVDGPDPVDIHVGARIRLRRTMLDISQAALGERIGIAFQQVQKQERGKNRISASALWRIAEALDVPVGFFFDGAAEAAAAPSTGPIGADEGEPDITRHEIQLIQHLRTLPDAAQETIARLIATAGSAAFARDD